MAELHLDQDERPGILKEIDEGAKDLIFQAMQEDIYSYPIRSFVRETISNCIDSNREKELARDILMFGAPESKYFLQREDDGKLLKDSSFDRDYYNTNYLSHDNTIFVTYEDKANRDVFTIKDQGVGLGGERLRGYFRLGYSSKRNLKNLIGKFGVGAKSGLATGVDYYTMETRYNGYKTTFMIFKHDYEAVTQEHPNGFSETWNVKLSDGSTSVRKIYWEPTVEENGVTLIIEAKKHNKSKYLDAVHKQFSAFNELIDFRYTKFGMNRGGLISTKALYEDENVLIQADSEYVSPHIIVDGINYGLISWNELELESRSGAVGIKVKATDVDINQSRETLKWTDKTKSTILDAIKKTQLAAQKFLGDNQNSQMTNDLLFAATQYLQKTGNKNSSSSPLAAFTYFLNTSDIQAKAKIELLDEEVTIKFNDVEDYYNKLGPVNVQKVTYIQSSSRPSYVSKVGVSKFEDFANMVVVIADETPLTKLKVRYLYENYNIRSFIYIRMSSKGWDKVENPLWQRYFLDVATHNIDDDEFTNFDTDSLEPEEEVEDNDVYNDAAEAARLRKLNKEVYPKIYTNVWADTYVSNSSVAVVSRPTVKRLQFKPLDFETVRMKISGNHYSSERDIVMFDSRHQALCVLIREIRAVFCKSHVVLPNLMVASSADYNTILESDFDFVQEFKSYLFNVTGSKLTVCKEFQYLYQFYQFAILFKDLNYTTRTDILKHTQVIKPKTLEFLYDYIDSKHFVYLIDSRVDRANITVFLDNIFKKQAPLVTQAMHYLMNMVSDLVNCQKLLAGGHTDTVNKILQREFQLTGITEIDAFDEETMEDLKNWSDHVRKNPVAMEVLYKGLNHMHSLGTDTVESVNKFTNLL